YGYPALTDEIRAKILGLNAASVYGIDVEATRCAIGDDDVSLAKAAIEADPSLKRPSYRKHGPQNRLVEASPAHSEIQKGPVARIACVLAIPRAHSSEPIS
ncbi:MAG: hypothetical protein O7F08_03495, partial [Deltaproteobacteria bacterium]|nr:hypothetical protein [Deltaproteobacteria bacterium]